MKNQQGQIIILLILVLVVGLAVGLSVIQRSLTDISTSSQVEQSARALSAAEAGLEKALQTNSGVSTSPIGDTSNIEQVYKVTIPAPGQALEYPPISREELAHVWLTDPQTLSSFYNTGTNDYLDIYWGNQDVSVSDVPAIAITVVYQSSDAGNPYNVKKYFYDPLSLRRANNSFDNPTGCSHSPITTSLSPTTPKSFYCKVKITVGTSVITDLSKLILIRARLLYNSTAQSFAVAPSTGKSLPIQAKIFVSVGSSGGTQRTIQLFQMDKYIVPPYLDYSIFAAGEISK